MKNVHWLIGAAIAFLLLKGDKMTEPRGFRNNNPFNIKQSDNAWQGKLQNPTDNTFEQFDTMASGVRAGFRLLNTYQTKHGLKTIRGIIARFAPKSENDTNAYIDFLAKKLSVTPDTELKPFQIFALGKYIIQFENGKPIDLETLLDGYKRAGF